jgi:hypothetical protein
MAIGVAISVGVRVRLITTLWVTMMMLVVTIVPLEIVVFVRLVTRRRGRLARIE